MTLARFQMCIGGEWVDALSGKTFESLNPASAQAWAELPDAGEADVERAVQAAQTAFDSPAWRGLTATARGKLLRRLGDLIAENKEQLAQLESRDNGKTDPRNPWSGRLSAGVLPLHRRPGRQARRRHPAAG